MTEILTESFCERCGTRYTFQTAAPKKVHSSRFKVLSKGLKNYVLSDETTLEEAFADARSEEDRATSSQQLEAFHQTFNFCMSCRQYTCSNCWNEGENRCLSCAPDLSREILPAPFPDLPVHGLDSGTNGASIAALGGASTQLPETGPEAWPEVDLDRLTAVVGGTNGSARHDEPEAAATMLDDEPEVAPLLAASAIGDAAAEPLAWPDELIGPEVDTAAGSATPEDVATTAAVESDALVAAADDDMVAPVQPDPAVAATDERAAAAAAQTSALFARFRPGQSLDAELDAYEREQEVADRASSDAAVDAAEAALVVAAVTPEDEREPEAQPELTAAAAAAALVAAAAAEHVAAGAQPEPQPEPAAVAEPEPRPEPEAVAEPEPQPVAGAEPDRPTDVVEQPTWRIIAPDTTPASPAEPPAAPTPSGAPQWPPVATNGSGPEWPTAAFLPSTTSRDSARDAMWAASSVDVAKAGGVQSCVSCGLSLSANARFCRRCGSRQGG